MIKINPFKPHNPVPPDMFAGREGEIREFIKGLYQTKNSHPINFLITGERGIGKSSLITLFDSLTKGDKLSEDYGHFGFVTIDLPITPSTDLITFIELIEEEITGSLGKIESMRSFLKDAWGFVQKLRVMGSGIEQRESSKKPDIAVNNFSRSLSETVARICKPERGEQARDGIVFFIDEADNACPDLHLGYFIKTVTEKLQRLGCNNVMFVIIGQPEVVSKLSESHESSIRIFRRLDITTLSSEESNKVVDNAVAVGNKINSEKTTISNKAKEFIWELSDGYPHFIQQFGYSAFERNTNGEISTDDVMSGAFDDGGAIEQIGQRYYESQYREQIQSDDYRQVLSIMAGNLNLWITRSDIKKEFTGSDHILTNALKALTDREIILKNISKRGEYKLQQKGFALWIKLFGERNNGGRQKKR